MQRTVEAGHKRADKNDKQPQTVSVKIKGIRGDTALNVQHGEECSDAELRALMGHDKFDHEALVSADIMSASGSRDPNLNSLAAAPNDVDKLMYTPVLIYHVEDWAMLDSDASLSFFLEECLQKHSIRVTTVSGNISGGRYSFVAQREGLALVCVINGSRIAIIMAKLMQMAPKRDMIIALPHFRPF